LAYMAGYGCGNPTDIDGVEIGDEPVSAVGEDGYGEGTPDWVLGDIIGS
jgi:hypothetical protein